MGLRMSPGTVVSQLQEMNNNLENVLSDVGQVLNDIEMFTDTTDELVGESYDSMRVYYSEIHVPVVKGVFMYAEHVKEKNKVYQEAITNYLTGIGYVDEDALNEYKKTIEEQIHRVYSCTSVLKGSYSSYLSCLEQALRLVNDKLEQIENFKVDTAGCYQEVSIYQSLVHRGVICIRGEHYDVKTNTYNIDSISKDLIDSLNALWDNREKINFQMYMQLQFGFDEKTVEIMWDVYERIQTYYPDLTQSERDWYFARAISQMGGYSDKKVFGWYETHAWRKGAGWAYEYDEEKTFFVDELGIAEEDYKYLRGMVRLQHFMTSNPEEYSYEAVVELKNNEYNVFEDWLAKMEDNTGKEFSDDEYLEYYKELYNVFGGKGDYSHMMYTISANLNDSDYKVDNKWNNLGAPELSWDSMEERKKIAGWLGDAVYTGDNDKVSFGNDDFVADLDADNIVNRVKEGHNLMTSINEYYGGIQDLTEVQAEEYRIKEFLSNNAYKDVESDILTRITVSDINADGEVTVEDILNDSKMNETYQDTYNFLLKLQAYRED